MTKSASELNLDKVQIMRDRLDDIREHLVKLLNFTVFSKTKFNENLEDSELLEFARKRFERSLPL